MDLLQQGIAAARAGRKPEARQLLMQVVEADERSEQGWLWLSGVVDDPNDIRTCLQNVLDINPGNAAAKKGLAWVEARYGPAQPAAARAEPPTPQAAAAEPEPPAPPAMPIRPPAASAALAAPPIEQAVGDAFTRTTMRMVPVPEQIAAMPRPTPAVPTQRFRLPPELAAPAGAPALPAKPAPQPQPAAPAAKRRPAPAPTAIYTPVEVGAPAAPPELPCPYCAAPTAPAQRRCTQCRQSLMVRAERPAQRSLALRLLSILWGVGGGFAILGGILVGVVMLLGPATGQRGPVFANSDFALALAGLIVAGLISFAIARGLWARLRTFYYIGIALILISAVARLILLARGAPFATELAARLLPGAQPIARLAAILPIVLGVLLVLLPIVLTILSYRDFFGPLERFTPALGKADHIVHYNNGIAYRNRGMLYMAIQEWAAASKQKPGDHTYLQALGLAYAQIKRLYPNSAAALGNIEAFLRMRKADLYAAAPELEQLKIV